MNIRIEAAGVCHSDLSVVNGTRPRPLPMALGHEAAGIVTTVGDEVSADLIGRRVVTTFLPRCGKCLGCRSAGALPCAQGSTANASGTLLTGERRIRRDGEIVNHHLGVSGFASHAVVDRRSVVAVGDDVPPDVAAVLGCAVLTGGGVFLNTAPVNSDSVVGVVGLGGVGMAALIVAKALGARRIVAIDALPDKLQRALELGADEAMTPDEALNSGVKVDVAAEAAGNTRAFETAFAITGVGGTTVTVGLPAPGQLSQIEPLTLTAEARTVKGSYMGSAVPERDIPRYEQLWRQSRLPVERLISSELPLYEINEAMDRLSDGTEIRQIIRFPSVQEQPHE
ncbi:zinc-binding dehydrogenase [Brevibacterium sp. UCMA 11754]|uniref:zinc-binding dehydrogenase n=1 Tax=Brevibacterium sp. UCMA 11754 TaxID=2749198 RepID=UPI003FA41D15